MKLNITAMKVRITQLLTGSPHLRDDDNKLLANIWNQELKKMGYEPSKINGFQLLEILSKGDLTSSESIRRARQKIQELEPALRGKSYIKRQANQKKIVKQVASFNHVNN